MCKRMLAFVVAAAVAHSFIHSFIHTYEHQHQCKATVTRCSFHFYKYILLRFAASAAFSLHLAAHFFRCHLSQLYFCSNNETEIFSLRSFCLHHIRYNTLDALFCAPQLWTPLSSVRNPFLSPLLLHSFCFRFFSTSKKKKKRTRNAIVLIKP